MQDWSDRPHTRAASSPTSPKRLGGYLLEAGLLTLDQINVILNDQQATGMRFGEIVVARGWLKEQTIEWIVEKVVEPERQALHHTPTPPVASLPRSQSNSDSTLSGDRAMSSSAPGIDRALSSKPFARREIPISKPLPSVNAADNGVYWVG